MALKPSIIKAISQRHKDLTFGYLKEKEKENNANYPQLIKYVVLLYSNATDGFDANTTHKELRINKNYISWSRKEESKVNSY